jgi:hypothetical protein
VDLDSFFADSGGGGGGAGMMGGNKTNTPQGGDTVTVDSGPVDVGGGSMTFNAPGSSNSLMMLVAVGFVALFLMVR